MKHLKASLFALFGAGAIVLCTDPVSAPLPVVLTLAVSIFFIGTSILNFLMSKVLVIKNSLTSWIVMSVVLCIVILQSLHQLSVLDSALMLTLASLLCWYLATSKHHQIDS